MSYPNPNRQNYRMRSNFTPPPVRNPYLSYQDLQKKMEQYQMSKPMIQSYDSPGDVPIIKEPKETKQMTTMCPFMMEPYVTAQDPNVSSNMKGSYVSNPEPSKTVPVLDPLKEPSLPDAKQTTPKSDTMSEPSTRLDSTPEVPSEPLPVMPGPSVIPPMKSEPVLPDPIPVTPPSATDSAPTMSPDSMTAYKSRTDRDYSYMNRIYPIDIRRVLAEVKSEFDQVDYPGSFIYDSYPDKTTLLQLTQKVYRSLLPITAEYDLDGNTLEEGILFLPDDDRLPGLLPKADSKLWMLYTVHTLVKSELLNRRNNMPSK